MRFKFRSLHINEVVVVEPTLLGDDRGFFMETFNRLAFAAAGINFAPVQENHSKSKKGIVRGLHYQTGLFTQAKLVRVIRGRVFDVAVDLRKYSPTFGRWVGKGLSERNRLMLYVPRGFAHGFASLEDNTEFVYLVDNDYSKANEHGVLWNDPKIGIKWPVKDPILSEKDKNWSTLDKAVLFT